MGFLRTTFGVKVCFWVSSCGLGPIPVLWGRLGLQCFPTFLGFSGGGGAVRSSDPRHKTCIGELADGHLDIRYS